MTQAVELNILVQKFADSDETLGMIFNVCKWEFRNFDKKVLTTA